MDVGPLEAKPLRFPPGRVEIRFDEPHRQAYRAIYARYQTFLDPNLPVLRERDLDGRPVKLTRAQLDALNRAFALLAGVSRVDGKPRNVYEAQERHKSRQTKKIQFLS